MKNKRLLKKVFLSENLGSKKEQEELIGVQNALNSMQSILDKGSIDKGHPAYKDIKKAVNSMKSITNPTNQQSSTGMHEGAFDDSYKKYEEEQEKKDSKKTKELNTLDEPFEKNMKECSCDFEKEHHIVVEPEREPLDSVEYVQLFVGPEEEESDTFKPAGSVNFDEEQVDNDDDLLRDFDEEEFSNRDIRFDRPRGF